MDHGRVPALTAGQRADALRLAARARAERAELRRRLKSGEADPLAVLALDGSAGPGAGSAARMRARDFIESLPGVGPATAEDVMAAVGIAPTRRLGGLGPRQRAELAAWAEGRVGVVRGTAALRAR